MFDLFLSYHWRDREPVEALARALRDRGLSVFLDRWYLVPGQPWPQNLEETLTACRAVAICLGPGPMGPWQQRETNFALERQARQPGFPAIPVLLPGAEPALGFLGQNTWVDLRERPDDPTVVEILALAARGEASGPELRERVRATLASVCPYRGLEFFREEDAAFFFGRAGAVDNLLQAIDRRPLVALVGASGSGKSSVARAGLIPALRKGALGKTWEIAALVPTDRPLQALAAALMPFLEPELSETDRLAEINKQSAYFASGQLGLRDVVRRLLEKQPGTDRLLLVVDQWEELYTLAAPDTSARFIAEILDTSAGERVSVVLTLRGDFFGHVLAHRPLADRLQDAVVHLGPMRPAELEQAIRAPADKLGLEFDPGLVPRILDDVGDEPGNLPLLEFVLRRLWETRQGPVLRDQEYEAMGRLKGALTKHADRVYAALSSLEQQALQRLFILLVRPGETSDTRRRATLDEIGIASASIVKRMSDERLLVTDHGQGQGQTKVEVAHETLIRHWDTLRKWVDADREFLLWRERLRAYVADWISAGRTKELLLREPLLSGAQSWLDRRGSDLTEPERAFISKGHRRAAWQSFWELFVPIVGIVLFSVLALNLGSWAIKHHFRGVYFDSMQSDKWERRLSDRAIRWLALRQAENANHGSTSIQSPIFSRRTELPSRGHVMAGDYTMGNVAFSPDSTMLASTWPGGAIVIWDLVRQKPLGGPLGQHSTRVEELTFSPDGSVLATSSMFETILWDVSKREPAWKPLGFLDWILSFAAPTAIAFSPKGDLFAIGRTDGRVLFWDTEKRKASGQPLQTSGSAITMAFSPDGKLLAVAGKSNSVVLWDVVSRTPDGKPLEGHSRKVTAVAFSRDGVLATAAGDKILLWDVERRKPLGAPLMTDSMHVDRLAFSPDGKLLAAAGAEFEFVVFDLVRGQSLYFPEHERRVYDATFSPNGKLLASTGIDYGILLWDVVPLPWPELACSIANRNLSRREWREAVGEAIPFQKVCPGLPEYPD